MASACLVLNLSKLNPDGLGMGADGSARSSGLSRFKWVTFVSALSAGSALIGESSGDTLGIAFGSFPTLIKSPLSWSRSAAVPGPGAAASGLALWLRLHLLLGATSICLSF